MNKIMNSNSRWVSGLLSFRKLSQMVRKAVVYNVQYKQNGIFFPVRFGPGIHK